MKLYLLRHGETDWNKAGRFQGQTDVPLNDAGRELARITRREMPPVKFDRVYCSPLQRAVETAHLFLEGRFPLEEIKLDKRIIEISFGEQEGASIQQAKDDPTHPMYDMLWHPDIYQPKGNAESFRQVVDRASDFLHNEILPLEGQCENVLVVAHGALNRSIVVAAGHKDLKDFWGARYYNCCVTTLEIEQGRIELLKEAEVFYDTSNLFAVSTK
ncbi:MAG: histidine phosphatase family protein [Bacteroidales bacterium]|nr:histidine phosphatase family protein [Bacteroidales bacterium]